MLSFSHLLHQRKQRQTVREVGFSEEKRFDVGDAHSSATLLSVLVLCGHAILLASTPAGHDATPWSMRLGLAGLAAASLAYLAATRRRPSFRAAQLIFAFFFGLHLLLAPWAGVRWLALGRPWEAFVLPHLGMASVGLLVPRSARVGFVAVLAFLAESLGLSLYFRHLGTPRAALPLNEPIFSLVFAAAGIMLVLMRRQRRALALRHLEAEAEIEALSHVSTAFRSLIDQMAEPLHKLSDDLERLSFYYGATVDHAQRAVGQLSSVRDHLRHVATGAPGEPAGEHQFYAREAHESAAILALGVLLFVLGAIYETGLHSVQPGHTLFTAHGVVIVAALIWLWSTRSRPSERRGIGLFLLLTLPFFAIEVNTQLAYSRLGTAFQPLVPFKVGLVVLPLVAPRHLWLTVGLVLAVAGEAVALYYIHGFSDGRMPFSDPWSIVLYLILGLGSLALRESRRIASLLLMRDTQERLALARQATLFAALFDRMGSPLQRLTLISETLKLRHPDWKERERLEQSIQALAAAYKQVPRPDPRTTQYLPASFDAEHELATLPTGENHGEHRLRQDRDVHRRRQHQGRAG
jgi:hypothetical protein